MVKKNISLSVILLQIKLPACAKCRYKRHPCQCVSSVVHAYNVKPPSFKSTFNINELLILKQMNLTLKYISSRFVGATISKMYTFITKQRDPLQ